MFRLHLKSIFYTNCKRLLQTPFRSLSTVSPSHEEHMLSNTKLYRKLLANLNLENVTVVEFGV